MVDSLLDGVPGLGPSRRKALLARFGSLKQLRTAADEISQVPGIGRRTARCRGRGRRRAAACRRGEHGDR